MEYLPTFPLECGHFSPNVGKYSLHGASGMDKQKQNNFYEVDVLQGDFETPL